MRDQFLFDRPTSAHRPGACERAINPDPGNGRKTLSSAPTGLFAALKPAQSWIARQQVLCVKFSNRRSWVGWVHAA
jgi:hypothetical protein